MQEVPKATSPIEAVTVSTYVMLVASSWFIHVDVNVAMVGPTKRLGSISSWGASMVICGGWPLIKELAISLKPGSSTFGGSSRKGLGIGDLHDGVELESPCSLLLCSSLWQCQALLLLKLQLWWYHLMSPKLGGHHPTGLPGKMDVFLSSWGVHILETPPPSCWSPVE